MFLTSLQPTPEAALRDVGAQRAEFRVAAARTLGTLGVAEEELRTAAARGIASLIADPSPTVRTAALDAAMEHGDPSLLELAMSAAGDPHSSVAARGVLAAGALGAPSVFLRETLTLHEERPQIAVAAIEAIVAANLRDEAGTIAEALESRHEFVRAAGAAAIAGLGAHDHRNAIAPLLGDPSPTVRLSAACALADMGDARGQTELVAAMESGSFEAADALRALATVAPDSMEPARDALARCVERFFVPLPTLAAAGAALAALGDPRGVEGLRRALHAFRPDGRPYAVAAAGELRLRELAPDLRRLLHRPRGADPDRIRQSLGAIEGEPCLAGSAQ